MIPMGEFSSLGSWIIMIMCNLENPESVLLCTDVFCVVATCLNKETQKCFRHNHVTHADVVYNNKVEGRNYRKYYYEMSFYITTMNGKICR